MRKEKSRSPPKRSNGRLPLILACLPTTCKNTDSQGCVSIDFTLYYRSKYDMKPAWVEQVENLLVALEMYRIEEEKAINHLADILTAYGIDVSAEEIRTTETETLKTTVREKVEVR